MDKILRIIGIGLLVAGVCIAWVPSEVQCQSRNGRRVEKRQQAIVDSLSYLRALEALQQGRYVIEVNRLSFKRGISAGVSTNANFIACDRTMAQMQITFSGVASGPSGIGIIALQGTVSEVHLEKDRKGVVHYEMHMQGGGIAADIRITLVPGCDRVSVDIDPDFNSNDLKMYGRIVPYDNSSVHFQGY